MDNAHFSVLDGRNSYAIGDFGIKKLSQTHRKHAYQRIVQAGFSHQNTILFSLILNLSALLIIVCAIKFKTLIFPFECLNLLIIWFAINSIEKRCPFEKHINVNWHLSIYNFS
jgi:hypothetical protein